jgi:hypothetical protein
MLLGKAVALIDFLFLEAKEIDLSLKKGKEMERETEKEKALIEVDRRKRKLLSYYPSKIWSYPQAAQLQLRLLLGCVFR